MDISSVFHGALRVERAEDWLCPVRFTSRQMAFYPTRPECIFYRASAGIRMELTTTEAELSFQYKCASRWCWWENSGPCIDVWEDGALREIRPIEEAGTFVYHRQAAGEGRVRFDFPHNAEMWVRDLRPSDFAPVPQRTRRLLVLGDSISQGLMGNGASQNYVTFFADHYDMELLNQSVGGDRFDPLKPDGDMPFSPTDILIALGTNDIAMTDDFDTIHAHMGDFLDLLQRAWPRARKIMLNPIFCFSFQPGFSGADPENGRRLCDRPAYAAFVRAEIFRQGKARGIPVIDGHRLLPAEKSFYSDEAHPNDAGFARMALSFLKEYEKFSSQCEILSESGGKRRDS